MLKDTAFTAFLEQSGNKLWGYHLPVPSTVAKTFLENDAKRVFCSLNGAPEFQAGIIPMGGDAYCITVNKKMRDALKLAPGIPVAVKIRKDDSEYGLPVPEEFIEAMAQDEAGESLFNALTPGKRRTLLYIVAQVKNSDLRIQRSLVILEHLKRFKGKIDYKALNTDLRSGL